MHEEYRNSSGLYPTEEMELEKSLLHLIAISLLTTTGKAHQKYMHEEYRNSSGLYPTEEMELEKSALRRIEEKCDGPTKKHFPRLVAFNNRSITTTAVGTSLAIPKSRRYQKSLKLESVINQTHNIIHCLRVSNVRHLDYKVDCKNIAISKKKIIALFDFDISVIDDKPLSPRINELYEHRLSFKDYAEDFAKNMLKCFGFCKKNCRQLFANYSTVDLETFSV